MANLKSISTKIRNSRKTLREIKKVTTKKFEQEKNILLQDFEFHPVTQEIMQGPEGTNISNTLIGYGNLYSFIGFEYGSNPISPVRKMIKNENKITSIRRAAGNKAKFDIKVRVVSLSDFKDVAPMPWQPGRSWVEGIERGISGLAYYLNVNRQSSRSKGGIQADKEIRIMAFKNTKYMSEIIRKFTKNLRKLK